jgi:hypothetical protein
MGTGLIALIIIVIILICGGLSVLAYVEYSGTAATTTTTPAATVTTPAATTTNPATSSTPAPSIVTPAATVPVQTNGMTYTAIITGAAANTVAQLQSALSGTTTAPFAASGSTLVGSANSLWFHVTNASGALTGGNVTIIDYSQSPPVSTTTPLSMPVIYNFKLGMSS